MSDTKLSREVGYLLSYYSNVPLLYPEFVSVGITLSCCARCRICAHWKERFEPDEELTIDEIRDIIAQLARMGVPKLDLTGGEPLMRREVTIAAARCARDYGLETFITTNAMLMDEPTARDLLQAGIKYFNISLDGATAATHDHIRGVKGCFDRVMRAVDMLKRWRPVDNPEAWISLTAIVNDRSLDELVEIVRLAESLELEGVTFNPYVIDSYRWERGDYDADEFWIKGDRIVVLRSAMAEIADMKRAGGRVHNPVEILEQIPDYFEQRERFDPGICLAGYRNMYINSFGFVDVCAKGPKVNIRETPIRSIWRSARFYRTRLKIRRCKTPCLYTCFKRIHVGDVMKDALGLGSGGEAGG
ncbi:radical SAM/SPASM domain-containing protein [Thermodesulfobacteriota bacterium]